MNKALNKIGLIASILGLVFNILMYYIYSKYIVTYIIGIISLSYIIIYLIIWIKNRIAEKLKSLIKSSTQNFKNELDNLKEQNEIFCNKLLKVHTSNLSTLYKENYNITYSDSNVIDFLESIDYNNIKYIKIIAHTGESLIKDVLSVLEENKLLLRKTRINVLLRDRLFEIGERAENIGTTITRIKNWKIKTHIKISVNFYHSLPLFRSIIIKYNNPEQHPFAFISFYHFIKDYSKSSKKGFFINQKLSKDIKIVEEVESWFNHYWGKTLNGNRNLHTIILDFDDTIVNSHDVQIDAWLEIVKDTDQNYLKPRIKEKATIAKKREEIALIFFEKQKAPLIFDEIFNINDDVEIEKINKKRFDIRAKNFYQKGLVNFFTDEHNFEKITEQLCENYNLVIISATHSDLITKFLGFHKPETEKYETYNNYFTYVFGKNEPGLNWRNFHEKSQLILKSINIIGIPLDRCIYIGDNNGDYLASSDIGIKFIEARLFEAELNNYGFESLIKDKSEDEEIKVIKNWNELVTRIREIEEEITNANMRS